MENKNEIQQLKNSIISLRAMLQTMLFMQAEMYAKQFNKDVKIVFKDAVEEYKKYEKELSKKPKSKLKK